MKITLKLVKLFSVITDNFSFSLNTNLNINLNLILKYTKLV